MKWADLRPGDQLIPMAMALRNDLGPCLVLEVNAVPQKPDEVEIVFLDLVHQKSFREKRYASGTAALGFELVRGGERVL